MTHVCFNQQERTSNSNWTIGYSWGGGRGVYIRQNLPTGLNLGLYGGENGLIVDKQQINALTDCDYLLEVEWQEQSIVIDGTGHWTSIVNHDSSRANVIFDSEGFLKVGPNAIQIPDGKFSNIVLK